MSMHTTRDGFALPATMLALVIIGALVTGGAYTAMMTDRSSANAATGRQAYLAAERGLEDLLGTKNRIYFEDSVGAPGAVDTIGPFSIKVDDFDARYTLFVTRLNTMLFMVESEGELVSGGRYAGSTRRLSELMRIHHTYIPKDRAVTIQGPLRTRGQSGISGQDVIPADWTGCTDDGLKAAVVAKDESAIDVKGKMGLVGSPEVKEQADLDSLKFSRYGDMELDKLKMVADKVFNGGTFSSIAPSESGGLCETSVANNWGAPADTASACHYYWPIIHSTGDLHISGSGSGQGILIVDGDFSITGNFEFTGLVFIYGGFKAAGTGNKLNGSVNVLAMSADTVDLGEASKGVGDTQIHRSTCAIERAYRYSARFSRPIPLAERKFIDISGLGISN